MTYYQAVYYQFFPRAILLRPGKTAQRRIVQGRFVRGRIDQGINFGHQIHHHNLRNNKNCKLPKYNKTMSQTYLFYKGLIMFNETNDEIKNEEELTDFKRKIEE
jgi:hypothetical protein